MLFDVTNEVTMAKRRNLKKEKALRNEAYARKFRKRNRNNRNYRRFQTDNRQENEEENTSTAATDT